MNVTPEQQQAHLRHAQVFGAVTTIRFDWCWVCVMGAR